MEKKGFSGVFIAGGFYCLRHAGEMQRSMVDGWVVTDVLTAKQGEAFLAWASHPDVVGWRDDGKTLAKDFLGDLVYSTTAIGLAGYYCAHRSGDLPELLSADDVSTWLIDVLPDQVVLSPGECDTFLDWANDENVRLWRAEGRGLYDGLREGEVIPDAGSPWKE